MPCKRNFESEDAVTWALQPTAKRGAGKEGEAVEDGTKELLGRALKLQLLEMPLDKVTVSRLPEKPG